MEIEEKYDKILKYCYMKTKDKHVAEDLTQETFLRFFENHKYKDVGKEMAYLYTISRNLCNDYFRQTPTIELDENLVDEKSNQKKIYIEEALEKLKDNEKELLFLRYTNEETINDIAKYYQVSRFVINRRIKKALNNLKEVYEHG